MVLCSEVRQIALSSSVNVELDAMSSLEKKRIFVFIYAVRRTRAFFSKAVQVKQLYKQYLKTAGNMLSGNKSHTNADADIKWTKKRPEYEQVWCRAKGGRAERLVVSNVSQEME